MRRHFNEGGLARLLLLWLFIFIKAYRILCHLNLLHQILLSRALPLRRCFHRVLWRQLLDILNAPKLLKLQILRRAPFHVIIGPKEARTGFLNRIVKRPLRLVQGEAQGAAFT